MKKILKELLPLIIIMFAIIFLLPLVLMLSSHNVSFSLYFKCVGFMLMFFLGFVLFVIILISVVQIVTKLINNTHDKNVKKAIIEKYNLTPNSFKEIDVEFEDDEETRNFFIEVIQSLVNHSNDNSYFNLKFQARIDDKTYDIPLKEDELSSATLIHIIELLGCKHYLHLDNNEKFFWYIKTSDNEVLYEEEIQNYDSILMCFTPKE